MTVSMVFSVFLIEMTKFMNSSFSLSVSFEETSTNGFDLHC